MNTDNLEEFIETIKEDTAKLKGRFPAISEKVKNERKGLKVKDIFRLPKKDFYLIVVKHYDKPPKYRYFIALSLARQSSDLLVSLVKDFALQHDLKLIQYGIYPRHNRVNLLSLRELAVVEEYEGILNIFEQFRYTFKSRIEKLKEYVVSDQKL